MRISTTISSGRVIALLGVFFAAVCFAGPVAAQSYKVSKFNAPPPESLSEAVREALSNEAIRVVGPEGPLCELWLRKLLPVRTGATPTLGVAYTQLAEGTLVGAMRFPADTTDYRKQQVTAGVYTLRFALHPVDGNHMGVSPYRDFLLLGPAADPNPRTVTPEHVLFLSRKVSGTGHPSIWSLVPAEGSGAEASLTHWDDEDLWVLEFEVPTQANEGPPSTLRLALVVVGHAREA